MSYSFTRDRTAELRRSMEVSNSTPNDSQSFHTVRSTTGLNHNDNTRPHESYINMDNDSSSTQNSHDFLKPRHQMQEHVIEMPNQTTASPAPMDINTLDGFFQEVEAIKDEITDINENIDNIERLHTNAIESTNEQQWSLVSKQLQNMKNDTSGRNLAIKQRLTELEKANSRQTDGPDYQIRSAQFTALKKRFMDTIQRYQDIERTYQMKYRQRIERQIKIVKPEATQDEIDDILDNADDDPQIFQQSIIQASRRGHAKAVLSEVQNRHQDIKNIENTIVELHRLFMDMSLLIEQQQETVDVVEEKAVETAVNLEKGTKKISTAKKLAQATRTKKLICLFLCIGICVMIAILVWWFGFHHKGVGDN